MAASPSAPSRSVTERPNADIIEVSFEHQGRKYAGRVVRFIRSGNLNISVWRAADKKKTTIQDIQLKACALRASKR